MHILYLVDILLNLVHAQLLKNLSHISIFVLWAMLTTMTTLTAFALISDWFTLLIDNFDINYGLSFDWWNRTRANRARFSPFCNHWGLLRSKLQDFLDLRLRILFLNEIIIFLLIRLIYNLILICKYFTFLILKVLAHFGVRFAQSFAIRERLSRYL